MSQSTRLPAAVVAFGLGSVRSTTRPATQAGGAVS